MSRNKAQNAAKAALVLDEERAFGDEPSLVKFDYLKLRETLEAIVAGMEDAAKDAEIAAEPEQAANLRLVVSNDQSEDRCFEDDGNPPSDKPVKLPA